MPILYVSLLLLVFRMKNCCIVDCLPSSTSSCIFIIALFLSLVSAFVFILFFRSSFVSSTGRFIFLDIFADKGRFKSEVMFSIPSWDIRFRSWSLSQRIEFGLLIGRENCLSTWQGVHHIMGNSGLSSYEEIFTQSRQRLWLHSRPVMGVRSSYICLHWSDMNSSKQCTHW